MAYSLCLLVKRAKTILLYNPQDNYLNDVHLEFVVFTHHCLIEKHFGEKTLLLGAKNRRATHTRETGCYNA